MGRPPTLLYAIDTGCTVIAVFPVRLSAKLNRLLLNGNMWMSSLLAPSGRGHPSRLVGLVYVLEANAVEHEFVIDQPIAKLRGDAALPSKYSTVENGAVSATVIPGYPISAPALMPTVGLPMRYF